MTCQRLFASIATAFFSCLLMTLFSSPPAASDPLAPSYTIVELNGGAAVVLGRFHAPAVFVPSETHPAGVAANAPLTERNRMLRNASSGSPPPFVIGQLGDSSLAIPMRAFVFRNGKFTDIGTLPGGTQSASRAVNNKGQVVGCSAVTQSVPLNHAFLYADGKLLDLNACIPMHSGWVLESAEAINDLGQITGIGAYHGRSRWFLLTPTKLAAEQAEQMRKQMEEKRQADDEARRPKSNLERLGPVAAQLLDGATRVETFRVTISQEKQSPSSARIEGTVITAIGPILDQTAAGQISAVLRDPKPYVVYSQPTCLMMPVVVFRVWKGKSYVDVVICFHCGQIVVRGYDDGGNRISEMGGLMIKEEVHTFSALAKQAFPQDAVIQAL